MSRTLTVEDGRTDFVIKTSVIDPSTGEVLFDTKKVKWGGWKNDAYNYRGKSKPVKFFMDMDWDLDKTSLYVFMKICKLMNKDNLLIRKSDNWEEKYFSERYMALTKEKIFEMLEDEMSESTFRRCWKKLNKKYLKKIKVEDNMVWAVNPAYAARIDYIPLFLYLPFKDDLEPFVSPSAKKKYENLFLEKLNKE